MLKAGLMFSHKQNDNKKKVKNLCLGDLSLETTQQLMIFIQGYFLYLTLLIPIS